MLSQSRQDRKVSIRYSFSLLKVILMPFDLGELDFLDRLEQPRGNSMSNKTFC